MNRCNYVSRLAAFAGLASVLGLSGMALGQEAAPVAAPPPPPPPVEAAPLMAPPVVMPPPPPPAPPPPPVADTVAKLINPHVWLRVGMKIQGTTDAKKLDDVQLDNVYGELHLGGQLTKIFGWTLNFNAKSTSSVNILDLIAQLDFCDAFHLWAGHLLVPSDRSNFSGPFFMSAWNYPGFYAGAYTIGPRTGPYGRDDGATIWGQFLGGKAKYYAGAFNLTHPADTTDMGKFATGNVLYTGRLNFTLMGEEPGFYHSSTYYGGKNIVALGVGGQFQKNGNGNPPDTTDFSLFMADLLAEQSFGAMGDGTLEGAFYHYGNGYNPGVVLNNAFFVLASYLTPEKMGIGKLQPLVRYQQATGPGSVKLSAVDAFLTYVVQDYGLRFHAGFRHEDLNGTPTNAIQVGVQFQE